MEALEMFRVAAGVPRYGLDITDRDLPQETSQQQALNFNKGCYIGQEIVERIRARGNVHRILAGLVIESTKPAKGKVELNGKEVGEVTSAAAVPSAAGDHVLALGIIRREAALPGTMVTVNGAAATVATLPFPEACS
jgi:aminomethyltransferase